MPPTKSFSSLLGRLSRMRAVLERLGGLPKHRGKFWGHNGLVGGLCAVSAAYVFRSLKKGIRSLRIVFNGDHCYNTFRKNNKLFVLDLTASQFDCLAETPFPKILITELKHIQQKFYFKRRDLYRQTEVFDDDGEFTSMLIAKRWPTYQLPAGINKARSR